MTQGDWIVLITAILIIIIIAVTVTWVILHPESWVAQNCTG